MEKMKLLGREKKSFTQIFPIFSLVLPYQIACVRRIDAKSAWTVSSRVEAISVRKECF